MLPESPMKIFAGLKLCGMNPRQDPITRTASNAAVDGTPPVVRHVYANSAAAAIPETPAASPSRPSIRFTALITTIVHATVMSADMSELSEISPAPGSQK